MSILASGSQRITSVLQHVAAGPAPEPETMRDAVAAHEADKKTPFIANKTRFNASAPASALQLVEPRGQQKLPVFGLGISTFQAYGEDVGPNNFTQEAAEGPGRSRVPQIGVPIEGGFAAFEDEIKLVAATGCNAFRFSIEWGHLFPEQADKHDPAALAKYQNAVRLCQEYGLEPMTTLVHFTEPTWFANSGGFANEANVQKFVDYGKFVFKNIPGIKKICTLNEPAVRAFMGHVYGAYPPHHRFNPFNAGAAKYIVENEMKAHVGVYEAIKSMPGGDQVQVGLVHNVLKFRPRQGGFWGWLVSLFSRWATRFTNDLVLDFFAHGRIGKFTHTARKGDFFGINCYGNAVITTGKNATNSFMGAGSLPDQPLSKMLVPYDPSGFSKAIDEVNKKTGLPICFTEFGYGDELGQDKVRQMHMEATLAIIDAKMAAGTPVLGIYPWTVRQGYEWDFNKEGTDKKTWVDLGHFNADGSPRDSVIVYAKYIAMKMKSAAERLKQAMSTSSDDTKQSA